MILSFIIWQFVTMTSYVILNSNSILKLKINQIKNENKKENKMKWSLSLILPSLQGFFSGETDFYFCQFLSNFLRYFSLNFPSSYLCNIFAIYFSSNSLLLKSFSFTLSNFSYYLTSIFILFSNSTTISFAFSKFFSLS